MLKRWTLSAGLLLAALLVVTPARSEELPPQAVVQGFYDTLLGVMKQADQLGFQGRYDRLRPTIESAYDLPLMTRLSVGPQWQSMSPQDQQNLTAAFIDYTVATYASQFDGYSGEKFEVAPQVNQSPNGTIVLTRLVKSDGEPVTLNYLLRNGGAKWQIIDVFLSGTVSQLATRRSEFTSVLRRDGAQGLLQLLDKRVAEMKAS